MSNDLKAIHAIGVQDFDHWLEPKDFVYTPHAARPLDIDIKVEVCGICGSDIHAAAGDWGRKYTPVAVGHEIIGKIVAMGDEVDKEKFHIGDRVGVGAQCESCDECWRCKHENQNSCRNIVETYLSFRKDGSHTQGGYADFVRIRSDFVFQIPDGLDSIHAAPLMCGGVTAFKPLLTGNVGPGTKVGIAGIGGIGHMCILFAKALGAEVTAISRNDKKRALVEKLGADHYVAMDDPEFPKKYLDTLDVVINTSSTFADSKVENVMSMLRPDGQYLFITAPKGDERLTVNPFFMFYNNYRIGGSVVGSPQQIEYMLQVAAKNHIKPWVETIDISEENVATAWKRMNKGDVRFRFVLTGYDKYFAKKE